jgi:hypothetical protein
MGPQLATPGCWFGDRVSALEARAARFRIAVHSRLSKACRMRLVGITLRAMRSRGRGFHASFKCFGAIGMPVHESVDLEDARLDEAQSKALLQQHTCPRAE